jgi:hypothetical protein
VLLLLVNDIILYTLLHVKGVCPSLFNARPSLNLPTAHTDATAEDGDENKTKAEKGDEKHQKHAN